MHFPGNIGTSKKSYIHVQHCHIKYWKGMCLETELIRETSHYYYDKAGSLGKKIRIFKKKFVWSSTSSSNC